MTNRLTHPTAVALIATGALLLAAAARDEGWAPLHDLSPVSWLIIALGYGGAMGLAGQQAEAEYARERAEQKQPAAASGAG